MNGRFRLTWEMERRSFCVKTVIKFKHQLKTGTSLLNFLWKNTLRRINGLTMRSEAAYKLSVQNKFLAI
jgi:hypothetical protein